MKRELRSYNIFDIQKTNYKQNQSKINHSFDIKVWSYMSGTSNNTVMCAFKIGRSKWKSVNMLKMCKLTSSAHARNTMAMHAFCSV